MHPTGFDSFGDFFSFTLAREYVELPQRGPFVYPQNWAEKVGLVLAMPVLKPANFFVREIRNPLIILALTVAAVSFVTFLFYPAEFAAVAYDILPSLAHLPGWMMKAALFTLIEMAVAGVGLRALGRVCNQALLGPWQERRIEPIHIGMRIVRL